MLTHLNVRNLAVIEAVNIELGPGLNVLTGETGAGKSIVVDALALLSGARAATELIRRGADSLTVTGIFRPQRGSVHDIMVAAGLSGDGKELLIRREISRDGPNRVFVDDEPVTLRLLAEIAPQLLRIHTQREELGLASPEFQRRLLDRSGGARGFELLSAVRDAYRTYRDLAERRDRLAGDEKSRMERLDLLRFQLGEIDGASLSAAEEDELRAERLVLRNSEAILEALGASVGSLFEDDGSAAERLATSARALDAVAEWEPRAAAWVRELEELRIRLDELSRDVGRRLGEVEADPTRLDVIEDRLALLERLFRKFGSTSAEVLACRELIAEELDELTMDDDSRQELDQKVTESLEAYCAAAVELSAARSRWADALSDGVHRELSDLAMAKAEFSVALMTVARASSALSIEGEGVEFGSDGIDEVTFELAANPGEAKGPLATVASGGELSRVYLALRLAAGAAEEGAVPSLVFDEIDAGIGGAEAAALGRKLRRLATSSQVLAVTHLPQVASYGHTHLRVHKVVAGGRTRIAVEGLEAESRVEEVARMLAGKKITSLSRSHAAELLAGVD